jgi:6-phosphogluconolactonase
VLLSQLTACSDDRAAALAAGGGAAAGLAGSPGSGGDSSAAAGALASGGAAPVVMAGAGTGGMVAGQPAGGSGGASTGGAPANVPFLYVGSGFYDLAEPQLYVFRLDAASGGLTEVQRLGVPASPSFIAVSPDRRHLYLNVEASPTAAIAFDIDETTGRLTELNRIQSGANGSAYIATDADGRFVLQANYESGSVTVLGTNPDGSLIGLVDERDMGGSDAYPHSVSVDPSNRFVFVTNRWNPSQPGNYIAQLKFDALTGKLSDNQPARVELPFGTGPRHFAFHPTLPRAYVNNERNATVGVYLFEAATGTLTRQQDAPDVSTLSPNAGGHSAPADMRIHPSGKFLYVANRGPESIALFRVDDETGLLTTLGHESFSGEPRNLFVDPNGRLLVVGNLKGNQVRLYAIEQDTGGLSLLAQPVAVPSPSGLAVVYLQGP